MSYITPDLTGTNPDYKVVNHAFKFIKMEQVLEFNDSVYLDSIELYQVGTTSTLITEWEARETDIDYSAISSMKLLDNTFSKTLVKSITITKPYVVDMTLNASYQKLYGVATTIALKNSKTQVDFTPEVLVDMLEKLQVHDNLLGSIKGSLAPTLVNPIFLEQDTHKEYPQNFISEEVYEIDTLVGVTSIRPVNCPFFRDSLQVYKRVLGNPDELLVEGVDYEVFGCEYDATRLTSNKSGLFKYIIFKTELKSTVVINYHAFGGDPSLYDMILLDTNMNNVISYLSNGGILTSESLASNLVITNITTKLAQLESDMRKLITEGTPSYGDVSNGGAILKKVQAADTDLHWWTIAELYKVNGSDQVITAEMGKFNISTLYSKLTFSATVNVNINNETNQFHVDVESSMMPLPYIPFENYDNIESVVRPQFRIIWNENTSEASGIYLQLGLQLKTTVEESIAVDDVSGNQSCFKLISEVAEVVGPEDDVLTLPSKNHVWSKSNPDSRMSSYLIPIKEGTICWVGMEPLNRPYGGKKQLTLDHFLEQEIDISRIKKIRYDLEENGGNRFPIYVDVLPGSEKLLGTTSFTYNGYPVYLNGAITREIDSSISMLLDVDVQAGIASNELSLRQVVLFT